MVIDTTPGMARYWRTLRQLALVVLSLLALLVSFSTIGAAAHEQRTVGGYSIVIGFIDEPVFTGQKSGLELLVTQDEEPVTGLAGTLQAEVVYGDDRRDLPLSPRFGQEGWYQSVFFPTAAGPYTFRIHGEINGMAIDESFTSSEEGFDEVRDATSGQFPVTLPSANELAADAERGAEAADQVMLSLIVGGLGVLLGLIAIGLAVGLRRRAA